MAKCILEELESRCDDCVDSVKAIDAPTPVQTTVPKIELRGDVTAPHLGVRSHD